MSEVEIIGDIDEEAVEIILMIHWVVGATPSICRRAGGT